MVRTINSMCLAAGPGPGGVSLTLRGKDLGAQGNWHPGGQGREGFQLSRLPADQLEHLPLATFHSGGGSLQRSRQNGLHRDAGCTFFHWRPRFWPREFRVLPRQNPDALILAQSYL